MSAYNDQIIVDSNDSIEILDRDLNKKISFPLNSLSCYSLIAAEDHLFIGSDDSLIAVDIHSLSSRSIPTIKSVYSLSYCSPDRIILGEGLGNIQLVKISYLSVVSSYKLPDMVAEIKATKNKNEFAFGIKGGLYFMNVVEDVIEENK
jgi:hypothetical protein